MSETQMAGIFDLESNHPRTVVSAGLASLALHGSLLALVFGGAHVLTEPSRLSPLRFAGQTFDVDALSESGQDSTLTSPAVASPEATSPEVTSPESPAPETAAPESPAPEALTAPKRTPQEPAAAAIAPTPPRPEQKTEPSAVEPAARPPTTSESKANLKAVDPFDLAQLPGEPTRSDALPASGTYGAEGTPAGVIDVFAAFLRKFPEAAKNEPTWETLASGFAGRIEFVVTLAEDKGGLTLTVDDTSPAPSYLHRSVVLTTHFLKHSQLAWRDGKAEGSQRLALSARVERRKASSNTSYSQGISAFGIHGEHRPNAAFFTYASGQHIEIELVHAP